MRTPARIIPQPHLERGWPYPKGKSVWVIETLDTTGELRYRWTFGLPLKYRTLEDAIEVARIQLPGASLSDLELMRFFNVKTEESIPFAALGL